MAYEYYKATMSPDEFARITEIRTFNELCARFPSFGDKRSVWGCDYGKTYREFYDEIASARGRLVNCGIGKGDHVALVMKNQYEFLLYFLASVTLGAVAVPVSMLTPPSVITGLCAKYDVKLALCREEIMPCFAEAEKFGFRAMDVKTLAACSPAPEAETAPDMPAAIMFTGGTTGGAKGVVLTHGNFMRGIINGAYGCSGCFEDSYLALIPFTHVFGLIRGALTALYCGCEIYTCEDMRNIFRDLTVSKPTVLVLVPALAAMVWGIAVTKGMDAVGGRLSYVISGGAAVPPELLDKYRQIGVRLYPGYGLTESANLVSGNIYTEEKPTSVGRPYSGQEVKVVDGELWLKGDNITPGYYKDDEANVQSFSEDGYFKTGDLVRIDADGDIYITGRIKNVIILSNGENVSPEELEAMINAVPLVQDCIVYEGKSPVGAAVIAAEIYPNAKAVEKSGCADPEAAIRAAVEKINSQLPEFMRVKKVSFRDTDFPRSASMKIIRNK